MKRKTPLTPTEQLLCDIKQPYTKRADGMIVVKGLDLGRDNLLARGMPLMTALPDLSNVIVEGEFRCSGVGLTSLKGGPQTVTGDYYCFGNKLESLEGAPERVGGGFFCSMNLFKDLTGAPKEIGGTLNCQSCPTLKSLTGAPEKVPGDFLCHEGVLESLEGGPREVGGSYWVHKNRLRSIAHAPRVVGADMMCHGNNGMTHLEGAPEAFQRLYSDLGDFMTADEIPEPLRHSPETRERMAEERRAAAARELEQNVQDATVTSRPVAVRKSTLRLVPKA